MEIAVNRGIPVKWKVRLGADCLGLDVPSVLSISP